MSKFNAILNPIIKAILKFVEASYKPYERPNYKIFKSCGIDIIIRIYRIEALGTRYTNVLACYKRFKSCGLNITMKIYCIEALYSKAGSNQLCKKANGSIFRINFNRNWVHQ